MVIVIHATAATLSLVLGAVNLARRPKGDRRHRLVGRVWVVAMYLAVLTSFAIREVNPGGFSWLHGLSAFTLVTLTVGWVAALRGRIETHRGFLRGSYVGTVAAFVGAVVVPQRAVPRLAVDHPWLLSVAAAAVLAVAWLVVALAGRPVRRRDVLISEARVPR
ncbi:DUF2306 domain-containing protein [Lapillicoccus jejuensis]